MGFSLASASSSLLSSLEESAAALVSFTSFSAPAEASAISSSESESSLLSAAAALALPLVFGRATPLGASSSSESLSESSLLSALAAGALAAPLVLAAAFLGATSVSLSELSLVPASSSSSLLEEGTGVGSFLAFLLFLSTLVAAVFAVDLAATFGVSTGLVTRPAFTFSVLATGAAAATLLVFLSLAIARNL